MAQSRTVRIWTPGFDMAHYWRLAQKYGLIQQEPNGNPNNWPGHWNRNGDFVPYPVLHMDVPVEPSREYINGELREVYSIIRTYELRKPNTNGVFCGALGCPGHRYLEVPWGRWELLDLFPRCELSQEEMDYYCLQHHEQKIEVKQYMATYGAYDMSQNGPGVTVLGLPDAEGYLPKPRESVSQVYQRASSPAARQARAPRKQQRVNRRQEEPTAPSKEDKAPNSSQGESPLEGYQWQNPPSLADDRDVTQFSNSSDQVGLPGSSGRDATDSDQYSQSLQGLAELVVGDDPEGAAFAEALLGYPLQHLSSV